MSFLYAIYAFVIAGINISAGMRMVRQEGWTQWVGFSGLAVAAVAFIAGFQSLFGFYVDPLMLLVPLVFAGFIITVDSWKNVKRGGFWAWFIALYNSLAWITNVIQLVLLLQRRRD